MYSNKALARFGFTAYFDISSRARLINGPSGLVSIEACNNTEEIDANSHGDKHRHKSNLTL